MVDEKGEWRVSYDSNGESGEWTIACSCRKFEQWGILCCHSLRILFCRDVKFLPQKYILKRWSRQARSGTFDDNRGKQIIVDPQSESSNRYKQLCPMLIRLVAEASDYLEACSVVYEGALELSKKVAAIRLNQQSHNICGSTCESTKCVEESSTLKRIGLKKKEGKKMNKYKRLKGWEDLQQKRRKIKPLQPSLHKSNQVVMEASSSAPSVVNAQLPPFALHSSSAPSVAPSVPLESCSYSGPFSSQPKQMSFTTMLMTEDGDNIPSLEAMEFSQTIFDHTSLLNCGEAPVHNNISHGH